jgi:hypothetical protein
MILLVLYLLFLTGAYLTGLSWLSMGMNPGALDAAWLLGLKCAATGGLGGCFYCLRAVYLNVAVRKQWSREWQIWYVLRPLVSAGSGAVSYLFMKAGLLILESGTKPGASEIGFYVIAFIAGLNVDRFIGKIEEVAESLWGIKKSRVGQGVEAPSTTQATTAPD